MKIKRMKMSEFEEWLKEHYQQSRKEYNKKYRAKVNEYQRRYEYARRKQQTDRV